MDTPSASCASTDVNLERAYLDETISTVENFLERAALRASGSEKTKFRHILERPKAGSFNILLSEDEGGCAREDIGGFIYAFNGKASGNDIFLCKKAMRKLSHDPKEGAQILIHELAHLEGANNECDATFVSMNAAALSGLTPGHQWTF